MKDKTTGTAKIDTETLHKKYLKERDKRLRKEGEAQYVEATGEFEGFIKDPYIDTPLEREPIVEDVDVAVVGGGFGGLITAAELRKKGVSSLKIIETAGDFGGTWYWNRYPGIRCDIESYIYMPLLEEVGTVPTERYATGKEIFEHCQAIGRHFDLYERAMFQTKVKSIRWDEAESRWFITTDRDDTIRARFVSVSQGPLSKVKLPGIPGIKTYKGKLFHSSRWDYDYTGGDSTGGMTKLESRRVGVIGTGATGIQIMPMLAKNAKHVYLFQRTPSSIDMRGNVPTDQKWFSSQKKGWQKDRMRNFLSIITGRPQNEDMVGDHWTDFWKRFGALMTEEHGKGSDTPPPVLMQRVDYQKMEEIRARVDDLVEDPDTAESLKPWYNYLCKRPLYSDSYLQAFNNPNVSLIDTDGQGVERFTETGIIANGTEYSVDCIIFATGFDVGAAAYKVGGYELVGRNGITLDQKWSKGMRSVHGTQFNGFPNFHIVGGVAQGITAFNFTHNLMIQAEHVVDMITQCLRDGVISMEVTEEAEQRWLRIMEEKHVDHSHFDEECTPGFLNNEGDLEGKPTFIGSTYGGGPLEYEELIRKWRKDQLKADTKIVFG